MMRWFLFCILSVNMNITIQQLEDCVPNCNPEACMNTVNQCLEHGNISVLQDFETGLVDLYVSEPTNYATGHLTAFVYRITQNIESTEFEGLSIYVNECQVSTEEIPSTAFVQLPKQLPVNEFHKMALFMVSLPQIAADVLVKSPNYLYNNTLVGVGVMEKQVSGLTEMVNISMNITAMTQVLKTHRPQCVFLNFTNLTLDTDGCFTQWKPGQNSVVCSSNHLTFFGVLMISNKENTQVSPADKKNLTYITFVGCSISFCALVVSVVLFATNRKVRADVSMKIHVNLAIALLLLNMHFLPSAATGIWTFSWPSSWLCFYLAIALHFSLLSSFSWMAIEGFHLYLLLVKVFNIHVKNYLLKVSIMGWGVPVVVVSIVVIINRDVYGSVSMDQSNSTEICFIRDDTIKTVTTVGLFGLVFLFNLSMLMVTVRNIVRMRKSKQFGPNDCNRTKKDICTLLGVITLLGTTWGLIFFSYGQLNTIGLYAFCILNPLQGLFILVWFVMSVLKMGKASRTSTATQSSHDTGGRKSS